MGQKINPIGLRLGIIKGWESSWYGGKNFSDKIVEDQKIRKYVYFRIPRGGISKIVIERTLKLLEITIHTSRPGIIIGKGGSEVEKLKGELKKITGKDVQLNIFEIEVAPFKISSSSIREKIAKGKKIDHLVNKHVEEYIKEHGLYGSESFT